MKWINLVTMTTVCMGTMLCGAAEINTLTEQEKADGWMLLFDGKTTEGWRSFKKDKVGDQWSVKDGILVLATDGSGKSNKTDLIYKKMFTDFELSLDWQISSNGNSGIFWRASEDAGSIWATCPEYQLNDGFPKLKEADVDLTKQAGGDFEMYPTNPDALKPAGEWNTSKIIVKGNDVQYFLNGIKTVEYTLYSDDWKQHLQKTKFKNSKKYAANKTGYIGLQHHGRDIKFRNIKLKEL